MVEVYRVKSETCLSLALYCEKNQRHKKNNNKTARIKEIMPKAKEVI